MSEKLTGLPALRAPFPPHLISKLPKPTKAQTDAVKADFKKGIRCTVCGAWHHPEVVHLDYVGHAALTDRLLDADPTWTWEPLSISPEGLPVLDPYGGMWIRLTVCGVTRLGYGHPDGKEGGNAIKEVIGDALRNAAMRFGAALDLWHKGDLHADDKGEDRTIKRPDPHDDPITGFAPLHAKMIRMAAASAIQNFNEGNDWTAYEEVISCVDKVGKDDHSKRNEVLLALSSIFNPYPALRASIKSHMEAARQKEKA